MKMSKIMAVLCVITTIVGLTDVGGDLFSGLCRGLGGVFFGLAFVALVVEKAEETEA
jgi:hypothetical protein